MDRLEGMKVFVQVVEASHFGKAAEALSMPKSTVSRIVKEMEDYLGVRLLQRTTRKLSVTPDGENYAVQCRHILAEIAAIESNFPNKAGKPKGRLKVSIPTSLAHHSILPVISQFIHQYPDIELLLCTSDQNVDLFHDGYDCVIRSGEIEDSTSLVARPLTVSSWVVVAAPTYIKRFGKPKDLDDLTNHYSIGYLSQNTGRAINWHFLDNEENVKIQIREALTVNDTDTYINCGLQGLGLIRIASYLAQPYIDNGTLIRVLEQYQSPVMSLSLVYPQNKHLKPSFLVFADWVKSVLAKE
ncbi:LysR family transcriptional regulator [Marinomonas spartinae]|uniref:LysR family transcriptional regulator n=1 Tax=Marinomonas spartinae TaxID=1792290 RepID=UPI0018F114F4|nr:LysR family transcriptional regulator [Marinomonas spartinae]MBJ7554351.1 LysR family transcriptional regulator [Marinomonas spartinae]